MSWIILAIINVFGLSLSTLFQRVAMKNEQNDAVISSIIFQYLSTIITFTYALTRGYTLPPIPLLPYFFISGALYAAGTLAFFRAMQTIEASESAILTGSGVIVTIVASFVFLGDRLRPEQLFGAFLILASVVIINFSRHILRMKQGSWLALLGTALYGLAVVSDTYIINHYNAVSFLPLICFISGTLLLFSHLKKTRALISGIRHIDKNLIIFIALYSVQSISFYMALERGALVSQMSTIARASIVLTVLLGAIFLKERDRMPKKIIGAILTTIGVLLVT